MLASGYFMLVSIIFCVNVSVTYCTIMLLTQGKVYIM